MPNQNNPAKEHQSDLALAKKLVQLEQSARTRGIHFDLSIKRLRELLKAKTCFYTGVTFDATNNIRSIERIDSDLGYVDTNLVACTQRSNSRKGDLSFEEIENYYLKLKAFKNKQSKKETHAKVVTKPARSKNVVKPVGEKFKNPRSVRKDTSGTSTSK